MAKNKQSITKYGDKTAAIYSSFINLIHDMFLILDHLKREGCEARKGGTYKRKKSESEHTDNGRHGTFCTSAGVLRPDRRGQSRAGGRFRVD